MPVHDWTRVDAGDFHDFHQCWIVQLRFALNNGVLPADYYAQVERVAGETIPDILTLQASEGGDQLTEPPGGSAVLTAPPPVRITKKFEQQIYISQKSCVVIRHASSRRIIAMIELVSPGNKSSTGHFRRFLTKVVSALDQGVLLLLIDLFPPTKRDLQGLHGAISAEMGDESYAPPDGKPLTLAAYVADLPCRAFVEPFAVGDELKPMPLYLTPDHYVLTPLTETYDEALSGLPSQVKEQLARPVE